VKFSVVIPTYNRPDQVPLCLDALARLNYPADDFEVILADDGSDSPLEDVMAPFRQKMCLSLVRLPHRGVAGARNGGVAAARGRFTVFTDDDCRCHPDWLRILSRYLDETPNAMIGGKVVNAAVDNRYSAVSQAILEAVYAHYNADPERSTFFAGANVAMPTAQYLALGGTDESFPVYGGEDRDFCARWLECGHPMRYAPEAIVYHAKELSFRSFSRMYYHYGGGAFHYQRRRAERGTGRWHDLSFYRNLANLFSPATRSVGVCRKFASAVLLLVWQVANTAGYARAWWARNRERRR
jgi:GT2 family glycosyltransferase